MPVLKAASEHASFDVVPTGTFFTMAELNGSVDRKYFDQRYVRGGQLANLARTSAEYWGMTLSTPRTSVWFHCELSYNGPGSSSVTAANQEIVQITGPATSSWPTGTPIVQISARPGQKQIYLSHRDGGGLNHDHGPLTIVNESSYTYDIFVDITAKTIQFYINGTLVYSSVGSANFLVSTITGARVTGRGMNAWFSQFILADESTVGWKVALVTGGPRITYDSFAFPTFAEWIAYNGATSFALQNYITDSQYNESTFITAQVTGQKSTVQEFNVAAAVPGMPTTVAAVVPYGAAKNTLTSQPTGWAWFLYRAGTVYNLTTFTVPKTNTMTRSNSVIATNPITGSGWTLSDFENFEMGVIST